MYEITSLYLKNEKKKEYEENKEEAKDEMTQSQKDFLSEIKDYKQSLEKWFQTGNWDELKQKKMDKTPIIIFNFGKVNAFFNDFQ